MQTLSDDPFRRQINLCRLLLPHSWTFRMAFETVECDALIKWPKESRVDYIYAKIILKI